MPLYFIAFIAPTDVQNLRAIETAPLTVVLSWKPPLETNGLLTAYNIQYFADNLVFKYKFLTIK